MTTTTRSRPLRRAALAALVVLASTACTVDPTAAPEGAGAPDAPTLDPATVAASGPALDGIVTEVLAATGVPGMAVGVVHGGEVVLTRGYGVRRATTPTEPTAASTTSSTNAGSTNAGSTNAGSTNAGSTNAVTADTVFQLASLSKPVGATAVAGVVGRGGLDWDRPVADELPGFELSDPYVTANVTVADLYSHRSGLPGTTAGNDLEAVGLGQEVIVDRLRFLPLAPFRATYSYSNFGMTVGGLAAAAAYGAPFADMAEQVLFEPAGMTSTSFRHDDLLVRPEVAALHARVDGELRPAFTRDPDAQAPAGGASSNVIDMSRWLLLQLDGGRLDGEQVIDGEALAETKRPHINTRPDGDPAEPGTQYGLGWEIGVSDVDPSLLTWSHTGEFTAGAANLVRLLPQLDLGIVVLSNAVPVGAVQAVADAYLETLLTGGTSVDWLSGWSAAFASLYEPPPRPVPSPPTPAKAPTAYVGTYRNDYLGDVVVREGSAGLELVRGPDGAAVVDLEHLDGDTFLYVDVPELQGFREQLTFEVPDDAGPATTLVLAAGTPDRPWNVLRRT